MVRPPPKVIPGPVNGRVPKWAPATRSRGADPNADSAAIRFSVDRWSPSGDLLLLTSEDAWHLLDLQSNDLRTLLELEEDEDAPPPPPASGLER